MATRVLIINRQLASAVALKQALERSGAFDVHPFTTVDTALEYLQTHPQDVALLDFPSVGSNGANVVEALRRLQPQIAIVASPQQSADIMKLLRLQESIDPPYGAREIIPLLNSAIATITRQTAQGEATRIFSEMESDTNASSKTRPSSGAAPVPATNTDVLRQPDPPTQGRDRSLRPGEIGEEQLRPYMYSTDLFKQRTSDLPPAAPPPTPVAADPTIPPSLRVGEFRTEDLPSISTDVFRETPDAPSPPPVEQRRRPGEFVTGDFASPSTDVFREQADAPANIPPLERPDRRRTGLFNEAPPVAPPSTDVLRPEAPPAPTARPGEFSEQDLLNLALNRGNMTEMTDAPPAPPRRARPGEILPEEAIEFRISTDIFKDSEAGDSSISPEDAAAMWEQLTREDTPIQGMAAIDAEYTSPLVGTGELFEFEGFDAALDDTPAQPQPAVPSATDVLVARANEIAIEFPLDEKPVSATDILLARAQEIEYSPPTEPPQTNLGVSWDFPDDLAAGQGTALLPSTDVLRHSRKPTEPIKDGSEPQEASPAYTDDLLAQQYAMDALTDGSVTDEVAAVYTMPFQEAAPTAEEEPPQRIVRTTEELAARYTMPFDEQAQSPQPAAAEVVPDFTFDDEDGFEPPISPDLLAERLGGITGTESLEAPVEFGDSAPLEYPIDEDAGVLRLEEIANEIRRTRETSRLAEEPVMNSADALFERLAAEEPPVPDALDDGGTVGDLYAGVNDASFQNVLQILRGDDAPARDLTPAPRREDSQPVVTQREIEDIFSAFGQPPRSREQVFVDLEQRLDGEPSNPAQLILETALDESTPADAFSLPALIANIERQLQEHKPDVRALPSWNKEGAATRDDFYVREPEFLGGVIADVDHLPVLEEEQDTFDDGTTYAGASPFIDHNMETEWLPAVTPRPDVLPEDAWSLEPAQGNDDTSSFTRSFEAEHPAQELPRLDEEPEFDSEFQRLAAMNMDEGEESEFTPSLGMPAIQDPYIAQIALSLTQVSLEEVAAAVLTREDQIVAFAGRLGRDDIEEMGAALAGQWDNDTDEANMRFVTLASSGKDYMLYSRRTINELSLSLVFAGATPLRDIRKQGKRLVEALMAVPDPQLELSNGYAGEALVAAQSDVRAVYTYVWLLRDPQQRLNDVVARAIETGINVQLTERAWQVHQLMVRDEFVYLLADVPGETPQYEIIRDLKRRSADIARKQNPSLGKSDLWADSYLVVSPGRELAEDEIQQFIQFERMA
jgi:DNA-binding NarL/FixJ family response regulator/REP element-mobilizing transposase RayT